ncbi:MAG: FIST C-terminal domain-containing protein [Clostridiales Family XIII bacterium]|jgi:hypothetical protein|nr:FIST C-terminal domain-containing protein [Clostridiales Family XIII bacterium]
MIEMYTAYTAEIDEVDDAIEELFGQIDLGNLKKNSVGIISCYYDFIETGVVQELVERLPFGVVGYTAMASLNDGDFGMYRLGLTVLTSDDVVFESTMTTALTAENYEEEIAKTYQEARRKLPSDPAFIISYFPIPADISGYDLTVAMDRACGGIPVWGGMSSDMDMTYEHCRTIGGGRIEQLGIAMILIHGDVEPEFILTSIPEENIREYSALITESSGCTLVTVNDMKPQAYLDSVGLKLTAENSATIPLLVDYGDGSTPVALGIFHVHENGDVLCGGEMPKGKTFSVGDISAEGIIETATISLNDALGSGKRSGLLLMPCVTRYIMLAPKQNAELEFVSEFLGDNIPYAMAYAGGEVCPVLDNDGKLHNRFHNYTFTACIL